MPSDQAHLSSAGSPWPWDPRSVPPLSPLPATEQGNKGTVGSHPPCSSWAWLDCRRCVDFSLWNACWFLQKSTWHCPHALHTPLPVSSVAFQKISGFSLLL